MKKLVVLVPFRDGEIEQISKAADGYTVVCAPKTPVEKQIELLSDAEICIGEPSWDAIENSNTLRLIQMTWAGADRYTRAGRPFPEKIALCTASGAFGMTMSHYALGAIHVLYHHFTDYRDQQNRQEWKQLPAERSMMGETILIFGAGNIGSCTAKLFKAAGAGEIIGVRRSSQIPDGFDEVVSLEDAENYLNWADIVIGCMPDTGTNRNYLDGRRLKMMKGGAVLINMGRGTLVDSMALYEEVHNGHLYGAVCDVTNPEPLPADHPLWKEKNVIITPHIAGPSFGNIQTEKLLAEICCKNIQSYIEGKALKNQVRFD